LYGSLTLYRATEVAFSTVNGSIRFVTTNAILLNRQAHEGIQSLIRVAIIFLEALISDGMFLIYDSVEYC
jgi:hypothetical protein